MSRPRTWRVLVLCTGNSARSVLAEVLLNALGEGRIAASSAGSRPAGRVHPVAVRVLEAHGLPIDGLRSKSWDEFAGPDAPSMDIVLTVCDGAAGEACPVWPGQPLRAHWGLPDPAAVEGDETSQRQAFESAFDVIFVRARALADLPLDDLDRDTLQARLRDIGEMTPSNAPGRLP